MVKSDFFKNFDPFTKLKLNIFRDYIREWLPVFITRSEREFSEILIVDGFSGRGEDSKGTHGTPIIILEEILSYYQNHNSIAGEKTVKILFNDINASYIDDLKQNAAPFISQILKFNKKTEVIFENLPFIRFWEKHRHLVRANTPSLVILDQYGFREITLDVFNDLIYSDRTDFMMFYTFSILKRFNSEESIKSKAPFEISDLRNIENSRLHIAVCDKYRTLIPKNSKYVLSPFAIQQSNTANVYGIIFGTSHYLGRSKFLDVAWKYDPWTGDKNFPANKTEKDYRNSQSYLPEIGLDNKPEKILNFESDLLEYIMDSSPTNVLLRDFTLDQGFRLSFSSDLLRSFQKEGKITVLDIDKKDRIRQGAFYLEEREARVIFKYNDLLF